MKNVLKIFSLVVVLGFVTKAHAGLMVEPYLAYELSSEMKLDSTVLGDSGGKTSGADFGLRLGYKLPMMVWLGLDYSLMSDGTYKANGASDAKIDRSNLYFDVGIDLPVLARVWLGYGLMNSAKLKASGMSDLTLKNGSSNIKLGVGLTMLPFVSLNLEYFMHDYKDYESGGASGSADSFFSSHKESGLQLGVSIPFNI